MKQYSIITALICLLLFTFNGNSTNTTPVNYSDSVRLSFYYDANLNGILDDGESMLTNLEINASVNFLREADGSIRILKNQTMTLKVNGASPHKKPLINMTSKEPVEVIMLPNLIYTIGDQDIVTGLADGYLTSPIRPAEINLDDYRNLLNNPTKWKTQSDPLYPKGWLYPGNYYFYGYRIPEGGLKGTPHLAFDIWANPGTAVLACAPGVIVEPLYDWQFGISGSFGTVYYNHIVPAVSIGDKVKRYDIIGYIAEGQGNHLHFECRPNAENILSAFPGVGEEFFIKSPLNGETVPIPPYFGP